MPIQLKIELLSADVWSLMRDKSERPDGMTIEGPICTSLNSPSAPHIPPYILVVITTAGAIAVGAAKAAMTDLAKERIKNWLAEFLIRAKTKRARINGREVETPADIERVLSEEIEIGKND